MIIEKGGWIRLFYTIILSAILYIFSTIILFDDHIVYNTLFVSMALGSSIWFVAELLFSLTQKIWPHKNIASFITLGIIIALGTSIGIIILGVTVLSIYLLILICAEVFGVGIVFIHQYYYKQKLNKQLKKYKEDSF